MEIFVENDKTTIPQSRGWLNKAGMLSLSEEDMQALITEIYGTSTLSPQATLTAQLCLDAVSVYAASKALLKDEGFIIRNEQTGASAPSPAYNALVTEAKRITKMIESLANM